MRTTIILIDPARFIDTHTTISRLDPGVRLFAALPLLVATADARGIGMVREVPGVVGVDEVNDWMFSMLAGLDRIALLLHGLDADWRVGGVAVREDYQLRSASRCRASLRGPVYVLPSTSPWPRRIPLSCRPTRATASTTSRGSWPR